MGIFIGGPLNGTRVTDQHLMHGDFFAAYEPEPAPETPPKRLPQVTDTVTIRYYHLALTEYQGRRQYHYLWEGMDQKEGVRRALEWHDKQLARG